MVGKDMIAVAIVLVVFLGATPIVVAQDEDDSPQLASHAAPSQQNNDPATATKTTPSSFPQAREFRSP